MERKLFPDEATINSAPPLFNDSSSSLQPSPTSLKWMATAETGKEPDCSTPSPRGVADDVALLAGGRVVASPDASSRKKSDGSCSPRPTSRKSGRALTAGVAHTCAADGKEYWEPDSLRGGFPGDRVPLVAPPPNSWSARPPRLSRSVGAAKTTEDLEPSALSFDNRRSIFGSATPTSDKKKVECHQEEPGSCSLPLASARDQANFKESIQGRRALAFLEEAVDKERQRHKHLEEYLLEQSEQLHSKIRDRQNELLAREVLATEKEAQLRQDLDKLEGKKQQHKSDKKAWKDKTVESIGMQKELQTMADAKMDEAVRRQDEIAARERHCQELEVELARREAELRGRESRATEIETALQKREDAAVSKQDLLETREKRCWIVAMVLLALLMITVIGAYMEGETVCAAREMRHEGLLASSTWSSIVGRICGTPGNSQRSA